MPLSVWIEQNEALLALAGAVSLLVFLGSLLLFPLVIIHLPKDYFARRPGQKPARTPLRVVLGLLKNAFGVLFVLAGLVMLFIPGQGLLAILVGISMVDFPGKQAFEGRIVRHPRVHRSIDWIRRRAGKEPIDLPPHP